MESYNLKIISFDKKYFDSSAIDLLIPLKTGNYEVLPGHTEFLARIGVGILKVTVDNENIKYFVINGGTIKVQKDSTTILTSTIIDKDTINNIDEKKLNSNFEKAKKEFDNSEPVSTIRDEKRTEYIWHKSILEVKKIK